MHLIFLLLSTDQQTNSYTNTGSCRSELTLTHILKYTTRQDLSSSKHLLLLLAARAHISIYLLVSFLEGILLSLSPSIHLCAIQGVASLPLSHPTVHKAHSSHSGSSHRSYSLVISFSHNRSDGSQDRAHNAHAHCCTNTLLRYIDCQQSAWISSSTTSNMCFCSHTYPGICLP